MTAGTAEAAPRDRRTRPLRPAPRRGLNREEAAAYVGIGVTKFDQMVSDGRMPPPKRIDGRKVWDVLRLDAAFDNLPDESEPVHNPWDD